MNETIPGMEDFRNMLYLIWKHLGLPDPTPAQYEIAGWMQTGPRRQITEAFRGVGKSFIAAAFVVWSLYHNPQTKFMVVSASAGRADAFSIFVKRIIEEMPGLEFLRPRDEQRTSNIMFDVGPASNDQSPSVKSVGITGQLTGSRADVIIADDCESLNNSATDDQRKKLAERIKEFDAVLKPGGRILYLGTPQTEQSIYNELGERGYETRIWPARYPDEVLRGKYGHQLSPYIRDLVEADASLEGHTTDPLRFTDLDLLEREQSYGRSGFALQFMLDTSLSDANRYPLKLSDLSILSLNAEDAPSKVVWAASPDLIASDLPNVGLKGDHLYRPMEVMKPYAPYQGCVMTIDPSGKGKDETGYAIVKMRNGQMYLTASGGFQDGYSPATLNALADLAKAHKVNEVVVEDNFGGGMFAALLRPAMAKKYAVTVTEIHSTGQKELRIIDTLEPVFNSHRLIVDELVIKNDLGGMDEDGAYKRNQHKTLMWQLTRLTRDRGALRHDDRIEALAMAVAYWMEALSRDVDRAVDEEREAELDLELANFIEHVMFAGDQRHQRSGEQKGFTEEQTWITQRFGR